ncbi:RNA polymerase sigma-70 factor [Hymenobacter taeanensis]|uniref:RNA polymerase sigma-70 factor n=1 Tax=Hymenobacter taeanensis TaxID=2735321 RepID=A0A6M6BF49_9BACT|nr:MULTISPECIES: RNA polymerase sigma-70 factor [Hymenobacter]QJX46579.1 RNA polymerase sigma-70 factor [Hymenobacter taeanensis]UOQ80440.1 RNA polymerase sigma-70 factor [Hymenobacter sp. 5414T-23]
MYASYSEATLLDALRAGDEGAFAEMYKRYSFRLFTVAYQKLKSREAAEELVQDLFENLWTRRATIQVEQLDHYLFSAIKYRIINYIKTQKLRAGYQLYMQVSVSEKNTETEEALALNDLTAALLAGMQDLPEKSREIFQLSRFEHYSVSEISGHINLSEKTVEYHLTKSLKLLRRYLRDFLLAVLPILFLLK